jgi:hypothetical protein
MTGSHLVKLFVASGFRLLCPAVVSCPKLPNSFTEAEKKEFITCWLEKYLCTVSKRI